MSKLKVIFRTTRMVYVTIMGEKKDPFSDPEDGGLIDDFKRFLRDNNISPQQHLPATGSYTGYFNTEDALKIEGWLFKQKAERV